MLAIIAIDPFESEGFEILCVQCRQLSIQMIEIAGQALDPGMRRIGKHAPVKLPCLRPFALLAKLASHEHQLLARRECLPGE